MSTRAPAEAASSSDTDTDTDTDADARDRLQAGSGPAVPVHVVVLIAAVAAGVVAQGGYYLQGRVLVTVLVAVVFVVALRARGWSRADGWPIAVPCAVLGAWAVFRAALGEGIADAFGAVATLGCVVAVVVALRRTGAAERERCAGAVVGIGVLVAVTAWVGVAWRVPRFAVLVEEKLWRGASTLTYPNAAAALLVPLALLAIAMLVARPRSIVRAAGAYLLLVGVGAALSRAGFIALLAGLGVLAVLAGVWSTVRHVVPLLLGAGIAVGALAPSFPATAQPQPGLAVLGLLGGAVVAVGTVRLPGGFRVAAVACALVLAGKVIWAQLGSGHLQAVLASRGNLDSSGRSGAAGAAFELLADHPFIGTGVGQARFFWTTPNGNGAIALYAHNEYLQTLVDLGAIGFVPLLGLLAAIVVTIRRGRAFPHRPGIWAGAAAALAAFAVHSGFDFLWHIAVLPLAGALFVGLAGPATSEEPISTEEKGRT